MLFPSGSGAPDLPNIPHIPQHSPIIPTDLSPLSKPELEALALALVDFMNGVPSHPEYQGELDRLTTELSDREQGGTP
jgi:hypothetical protein